MGPEDVPGVGRLAQVVDPFGAPFALITSAAGWISCEDTRMLFCGGECTTCELSSCTFPATECGSAEDC
jgi:hypothetical protein